MFLFASHSLTRTRVFIGFNLIFSDVERGDFNLTFPLTIDPSMSGFLALPVFFGGSVIDDGVIKSVPSVQLAYFITVDNPRQDAM